MNMRLMEKINPTPNGFLLIDKPAGPTSHDLVDRLRRVTGIRQIGHAGTLDPFATGLLLFGIGPATKQLNQLVGLGKEYVATFILGASSDTDDVAGRITKIEGQKSALSSSRVSSAPSNKSLRPMLPLKSTAKKCTKLRARESRS